MTLPTRPSVARSLHSSTSMNRRYEMDDRKNRTLLGALGAGIAAIAAATLLSKRMRKRRLPRMRRNALKRAWMHPERLAENGAPPFWERVAERLLIAAASAAIIPTIKMITTKRAAQH